MFIDLNCFLRWAMWPMGLLFCKIYTLFLKIYTPGVPALQKMNRNLNKRHMGHIAHLKTTSNQWILWAKLWLYILWNWSSSSVGKTINFRECTYAILLLSPNEKMCGLSIWTTENILYPGMLSAKFGWNSSQCIFAIS